MEGPKKTLVTVFALAGTIGGAAQAQVGFFDLADKVEGVNSSLVDENPVISPDGLELYFTRVGPDSGFDVWVAARDLTDEPFGTPRNLVELNTQIADATPTGLSGDGLTLYFTSNHPEGGKGNWDIWVAERSALGQPFRVVRNCEELNTEALEDFATVTADGLEIYFMRERAGTSGDLHVARRATTDELFGEPTPLAEVNTAGWDTNPFITPDGLTLFFCGFKSNRPSGFGGNDMWMATRSRRVDESGRVRFGAPVNLGSQVNTGFHDYGPIVSPDWPASGALLYFSRNPGTGNSDIYQATWHPDCNQNAIDDLDDIAAGTSPDQNADGLPDECALTFLRGESNDDGVVDLSDAVRTLGWLFVAGAEPGCIAATNVNDDDDVDVSDAVYLLAFLFQGAPEPLPPFPGCGPGSRAADVTLGCRLKPRVCP